MAVRNQVLDKIAEKIKGSEIDDCERNCILETILSLLTGNQVTPKSTRNEVLMQILQHYQS